MAFTDVYTGANGSLTLVGTDSTPEKAAASQIIGHDPFSLSEVGRVTGVEIHVETDLEEFHEIGKRHATSLHPGNIHIWGTVDRAFVNGALLYLLLGQGAVPAKAPEPYVQPALDMRVVLDDPVNPTHRSVIELTGVKFENWAFSLPEDDFVLENARFKALGINTQDQKDETSASPFPA